MSAHLEDLENELVNHPERVLVIAGAGVSMATHPRNPCAGWKGLLQHGVEWCRARCPRLRPEWFSTVDSLFKLDKLVSIADLVVAELKDVLEGEYSRCRANASKSTTAQVLIRPILSGATFPEVFHRHTMATLESDRSGRWSFCGADFPAAHACDSSTLRKVALPRGFSPSLLSSSWSGEFRGVLMRSP